MPKFNVVILEPYTTDQTARRSEVKGVIDTDVRASELDRIIETEQFLERLTGVRFHINTVR